MATAAGAQEDTAMAEDRRDLWKTTSIGLVIAAIVAVYDNKKHDEAYRSASAGCMKAKGYTG